MKKNYYFKFWQFRSLIALVGLFFLGISTAADLTNGLKLHYNFSTATVTGTTVNDASHESNIPGELMGTAIVDEYFGKRAMYIPLERDDYAGLEISALSTLMNTLSGDYTISLDVYAGENYVQRGWLFGYSSSQNHYMCLHSKNHQFAITEASWNNEQAVFMDGDYTKNEWTRVTFVQKGDTGRLYINNALESTNNNITLRPADFQDLDNLRGHLQANTVWNDGAAQDLYLTDFRIYNRALTEEEVMLLNGTSDVLINAFNDLTENLIKNNNEDLSVVMSDLNLISTLNGGVTIEWESSNPAVLDNTGKVSRPEKYNTYVTLTATLYLETEGEVNSMRKSFVVCVLSPEGTPEHIAQWDFSDESVSIESGLVTVADKSGEFVGTVMNEARIRTIGETNQFNVLDLGNGTGYFDMGTPIGEAIYNLKDYTIMGYFYIDENYSGLSNNGNYMWSFSNSNNSPVEQNGYMLGRLNNMGMEITPEYYASGNQSLFVGSAASQGAWHHIAFSQSGNTQTIYVDGVETATGSITNLPFSTLALNERSGTYFNWLGRSCYPSDTYLKQTLLFDFNVYSIPLTQDNLVYDFGVRDIIDQLNNAYIENPDFISENIRNEAENLNIGDLSALASDISLPKQGTLDSEISISWSSSHPQLISNEGMVTQPDYFDFDVTLTATIAKGSQLISKDFPATVLVKKGTEFTGDLIAHYDFSNEDGRFVKSLAEKQFEGVLVNEATIREIGTDETGKFKVLDLGNETGYFDMGEEVGKVLVHANDYSISAYYRIDTAYSELTFNGNFLWTFSNSNDSFADQNGYIIGSLLSQGNSITPAYYSTESGNQSVSLLEPAPKGSWHHIGYTQQAGIGTIYIDGIPTLFGDITNTPTFALKKDGLLGTLYNWIGRSNFVNDVYLRNTLVYDFRLYNRALSDAEMAITEQDVSGTIEGLNKAYDANPNIPNSVESMNFSPYLIVRKHDGFRIIGLKGTEQISLFDLTGRQLQMNAHQDEFILEKGVYIVKIDYYTSKILVN